MAASYPSTAKALEDIANLAVGQVIDINGRAARVVIVQGGAKTIQFLKSHQNAHPQELSRRDGRYYAGSSSKGAFVKNEDPE